MLWESNLCKIIVLKERFIWNTEYVWIVTACNASNSKIVSLESQFDIQENKRLLTSIDYSSSF